MAATRFGLTWWGQRWIAALETLGRAYANRLPRGRTYARNGSVTDLTVAPGVVTARVHGSRRTPYRVSLRIPAFTEPQWTAATHALARQLRHAAALLDGRMPEDIDETLDAVGLSLFPTARDLTTTCSCPDEANPCKHVAAVHYTLAHTFDADPFLLPALRGRDRAALLAELRTARTGTAGPGPDEPTGNGRGVPISTLSAATLFSAASDLTTIALRPDDTTDPQTTLRRLGPPPGFDTLDLLADAVRRGAERASSLIHDNTDDPILTTLRHIGPASAAELSTALDQPATELRAVLRALVATGLVSRTGHARTTKYHA
jgi:uncharacterized Zn finger protein